LVLFGVLAVDQRIVQFINALRTAGVRVSLAESEDAFQAVDKLGIRNRDVFRISLKATLVKEERDQASFEELFPLFFDTNESPLMQNFANDFSAAELEAIREAIRQFKERIQEMLDRLLQGDELSPAELERLANMVGLDRVDDLRYRNWMVQRMQQALRFPEIREAIRELQELLEALGMDPQRADQLRQMLKANQQAIAEQLEQFSGQRIAENMSQRPPKSDSRLLYDQPFDMLSDKELELLRKDVQRLAAILRTRVALRMKRARSGQLDAKATIRANLKHGNVPMEIRHRDRTLKPKLVAICDISTSMRPCSELMLSLLYALQDQISKTHAFAFIDHLEYISPDFQMNDSRRAVQQVLLRMPSGHYNTDLGSSLHDFMKGYCDLIDFRTTLIVVGDARNNYNDPRLDLMRKLSQRAQRLIWMNPEAPAIWGSGDSDMLGYVPYCNVILQVRTFSELADAVDKLLTTH
jgi:uncharacterized protein